MKNVEWDNSKNEWLRQTRNIDFELILTGELIRVTPHSNLKKYPNQKIMFILYLEYVYLVPFVEDSEKIFLKTIIPSRKATREYFETSEVS